MKMHRAAIFRQDRVGFFYTPLMRGITQLDFSLYFQLLRHMAPQLLRVRRKPSTQY